MISPDILRVMHRIVGTAAFLAGLVANVVLMVLVHRLKLGAYKRLLVVMGIVDFTFLFLTAIAFPIIVLVEGNEIVLQNGYFRHSSQPWNGVIVAAWVFGLYFAISSISAQFVFRWLILCKKHNVANRTLAFMMAVPFLVSVGVAVLYYIGFLYPHSDESFATNILREFLLESGEKSVFPGGVSRKGNRLLLALALAAVAVMVGSYAVVLFCVWQIQSTLRELSPSLKPATRALHAQLSRTLFIQAVSPLVVSIVPLSYLCWAIIAEQTAFLSMMVMTVGFSWVPFTNAAVTLVLVRQFRRGIAEFLRGLRRCAWREGGESESTPASVFPRGVGGTSTFGTSSDADF